MSYPDPSQPQRPRQQSQPSRYELNQGRSSNPVATAAVVIIAIIAVLFFVNAISEKSAEQSQARERAEQGIRCSVVGVPLPDDCPTY